MAAGQPAPTATEKPAVDPQTGLVRSQRLESGVPLGGLGTGTFQLMTDGAISRAAITNNWQHPTGDLPGCFAALWTRAGSRVSARALALQSAYQLPSVAGLDYDGRYPLARLTYRDPALPLDVLLTAFSPLIPRDLRNSSFPAAAFLFRFRNTTAAPIEISVALSWENILGVGGSGAYGPFSNRDGNQVVPLPGAEGFFGLKFTGPPPQPPTASAVERLRDNATGDMALLAYPPRKDAQVTIAGWNALDRRPPWWERFAQEGQVAGEAPSGREGQAHPAGVVAVRLIVRPREEITLPFAVAWYTPVLRTLSGVDQGHYYQNLFADAVAAGRALLSDWLSLLNLTEEWQSRLRFSNLPPWLSRRLVNCAVPLTVHSIFTRDGRFALLRAVGLGAAPRSVQETFEYGILNTLPDQWGVATLLLAFFPTLHARMLQEFAGSVAPGDRLPATLGYLDVGMVGGEVALPPRSRGPEELNREDIENGCVFTRLCGQYVALTDDRALLSIIFPHIQRFLSAQLARSEEGLPIALLPEARQNSASSSLGQAKRRGDSIALWLSALETGASLAEKAAAEVMRPGGAASVGPLAMDAPTARALALGESRRYLALAQEYRAAARRGGQTAERRAGKTAPREFGVSSLVLSEAVKRIQMGLPAEGIEQLRAEDTRQNLLLRSPWQTPLEVSEGGSCAILAGTGALEAGFDWNALWALAGFALELETGELTLTPQLPGTWRRFAAPIFAPTFWGWFEFRPQAHGSILSFRLDRVVPVAPIQPTLRRTGSARLTLRALRVPGPPVATGRAADAPISVSVSLRRSPLGCRVNREPSGDLNIVFDAPLALAAGDRLEIDVQE